MKTSSVSKKGGGKIPSCMVNELASLVWITNLADLEMHTFLYKARALDRHGVMVFDLYPGAPVDIINCCEVALMDKGDGT